jgi:alkylation response protein AidB-like acyl-CoA dehydrogenase
MTGNGCRLDAVHAVAERLWRDAAKVDATGQLPAEHLRLLAEAGLYGIAAPVSAGGLGLGQQEICSVTEELASACLATTFVWLQHLRLMGAVLDDETPEPLRTKLLPGVIRGDVRGGIALTGALPGPPRLTAEQAPGGWRLTGQAPWVTGWGHIHFVVAVARASADSVVTLLVAAGERPGLSAEPQRLAAVQASATVRLRFDGLFVPAAQQVGREPYDPAGPLAGRLRLNGSLALGIGRRCCALIGPSALDEELRQRRAQLDNAGPQQMPAARARASEFAVRAAHALAVHHGSASALAGDDAERLTREAAFLLVFGSRPAIKESLFRHLSTSHPDGK